LIILYHINNRQQPLTQQQQAADDQPAPGQHPSAQRLSLRLHSRIMATDCNSSLRVMRRRQDDSAALPAASLMTNDAAAQEMWQRLQFDATAAIPLRLLWQTSRASQLGAKAAAAQATWVSLNPGLNLTMHNDSAAEGFIQDFYGPAASAVYRSFPLGVMRSDFWRYAVSGRGGGG
jgi:mannosyltransferase OCH1-like enzyme